MSTWMPIVLTEQGDTLLERSDRRGAPPLSDETSLGGGVHAICGGCIDYRRTTNTHSVLLCRACGLRLVIPADVVTYGQLRGHLTTLQPGQAAPA